MKTEETNAGNGPDVTGLLTRADLQRILRLSTRTIRRLLAARELPAPIRVGHSDRWRPEDVQTYLQSKNLNLSEENQ
jgi:predicted DNA-binding transcriptional regulator AlpA